MRTATPLNQRSAAAWGRSSNRLLIALVLCILGMATGCSSGLSLFPTGHFLLKRTREVASPTPLASALNRELDKSVLPALYIGPGDTLVVESISFDSPIRFPADQLVLADGTIDLGRYGRLVVAGMTLEDIEDAVLNRVEEIEGDEVEPVNVRLIDTQGAVYYVLGEVSAPGSYPLVGRETVLDAILAAGGLTNRASPCNIVLTRPSLPDDCRIVLPVCYRQITQLGDTTTNYQIMPGDRITVATRDMCEDLKFWKAKDACEACKCHRQCPCPDASEQHTEDRVFNDVPPSPEIVRYPKPIRQAEE